MAPAVVVGCRALSVAAGAVEARLGTGSLGRAAPRRHRVTCGYTSSTVWITSTSSTTTSVLSPGEQCWVICICVPPCLVNPIEQNASMRQIYNERSPDVMGAAPQSCTTCLPRDCPSHVPSLLWAPQPQGSQGAVGSSSPTACCGWGWQEQAWGQQGTTAPDPHELLLPTRPLAVKPTPSCSPWGYKPYP